MRMLCGFLHSHKYIMPAWYNGVGTTYNIMLTDENDKPLVFLNQEHDGTLSVLAKKGSKDFSLMTDFCNAEKVFKEFADYKEY